MAVEILKPASDDALIEQATKAYYAKGGRAVAEGFEVWDGPRFVHRYPTDLLAPDKRRGPG